MIHEAREAAGIMFLSNRIATANQTEREDDHATCGSGQEWHGEVLPGQWHWWWSWGWAEYINHLDHATRHAHPIESVAIHLDEWEFRQWNPIVRSHVSFVKAQRLLAVTLARVPHSSEMIALQPIYDL